MQPPPGAAGALLDAADTIDIPVLLRRGPLAPVRRPFPKTIDAVSAAWPGGLVPPSGRYLVRTTWRELLDAAICVGRDPVDWLIAVPELAYAEIVARCAPLIAYLGRTPHRGGPVPGAHQLLPNVVYQHGTESSALGTFGYRLGMTMADWAAQSLFGLGPTIHAEAVVPAYAGPGWTKVAGLPDLVACQPGSALPWLIEAKGRRRLGLPDLREGAAQLCRPGLMAGPHMRMLCGTSVEHRVFVTLDIEQVQPPAPSPSGQQQGPDPDADGLLALARARMLTYLLLRGTPPGRLRITPVGARVTEPRAARAAGAMLLLESDPSTRAARADATQPERYRSRPPQQRFDLLTARVPGTELILGMSRRLYAACEELATTDQALAASVAAEAPMPASDADGEDAQLAEAEWDRWRARRDGLYWERQRQERRVLAGRVRSGFDRGARARWEDLIDTRPDILGGPPPGYLEAATADTYLAVHRRTATQVSG
jgi:hypothetical protein